MLYVKTDVVFLRPQDYVTFGLIIMACSVLNPGSVLTPHLKTPMTCRRFCPIYRCRNNGAVLVQRQLAMNRFQC
jgi:hypothetical protein